MNDSTKSPTSLIENINTAVLVFDEELRLKSINASGENLLSVSINKVIGQSPDEFLQGASRFNENLNRTLVEMRPYTDWDMISTYMNSDEGVESIMSPILNNFIIIKDASGLVYWPAIPVSTL